ncbi:Wzz/FepE/Etk N-terminal domain-containing protein [Flectobacillus longus]|uniref:Wzz/FepE/Etk N-terminal domain-containing protein n=1 Tax=Flectobacillus longus TaxID=2984207 RepID=UPI00286E4E4D|nr:Wzz/FepE/Etk N-terminal domain-containing protein [Flectobacillus longus]
MYYFIQKHFYIFSLWLIAKSFRYRIHFFLHLDTNKNHITISIKDLISGLVQGKRFILLMSLSFGILGALYAISLPNLYTSEVKILPEIDTKNIESLDKFKSLAGLAGIDLDNLNSTEAIRPDLYPPILQSTPFLLSTFRAPVVVAKTQVKTTLFEYLNGLRKQKLSYRIFGESTSDAIQISATQTPENSLLLSKQEAVILKDLRENITASLDKKSGVISINAKMPDPLVATIVVKYAQDYLNQYVKKYRLEKIQKEVVFLEKRVDEAQQRYQIALQRYSAFQDSHRGLFLNTSRQQEQKLQQESELAFSLFSELSKKLEESRVKVQHDTPVFQILEPAQVPLKKSEPKRTVMVFAFMILGGMIACLTLMIRYFRVSKLFF